MACVDNKFGLSERIANISSIREDIRSYEPLITIKPEDENFTQATERTLNAFLLSEPVKLCHLCDLFEKDLPIWSSSPGLPWIDIGYKTKGDIQSDPVAIQSVRRFWHRIKNGENLALPHCYIYASTHIDNQGAEEVNVEWVYPATVTFGEAVFALPLNDAYKSTEFKTYPIDYELKAGPRGCKKLYSSFRVNYFLGIVFKNFNKILPPWILHMAFDMLAKNIDFCNYEGGGTPRLHEMYRMFQAVSNYAIRTPIQLPNGERYCKSWGLANGSYFSGLVESICNYLLVTYACLKCGVEITSIKVFGSNSIIGVNKPLSLNDIASVLEPLGMTLNVTNSISETNIKQLKYFRDENNHSYYKWGRQYRRRSRRSHRSRVRFGVISQRRRRRRRHRINA